MAEFIKLCNKPKYGIREIKQMQHDIKSNSCYQSTLSTTYINKNYIYGYYYEGIYLYIKGKNSPGSEYDITIAFLSKEKLNHWRKKHLKSSNKISELLKDCQETQSELRGLKEAIKFSTVGPLYQQAKEDFEEKKSEI